MAVVVLIIDYSRWRGLRGDFRTQGREFRIQEFRTKLYF
jgi:hypothetical protein